MTNEDPADLHHTAFTQQDRCPQCGFHHSTAFCPGSQGPPLQIYPPPQASVDLSPLVKELAASNEKVRKASCDLMTLGVTLMQVRDHLSKTEQKAIDLALDAVGISGTTLKSSDRN